MKKFNTILAIAAVALTSVFGFTSCDKNDDSINNIPAPNPTTKETPVPVPVEQDLYFYAPATAEQLKYMDATFTLSVDGQTKEIKLSEMAETKDANRLAQTSFMRKIYDDSDPAVRISETKMYEYHIGIAKDARVVSAKYTSSTAKTDHWIDAFTGGSVMTDQGKITNITKVDYYSQFDDLSSFVETMNFIYR